MEWFIAAQKWRKLDRVEGEAGWFWSDGPRPWTAVPAGASREIGFCPLSQTLLA